MHEAPPVVIEMRQCGVGLSLDQHDGTASHRAGHSLGSTCRPSASEIVHNPPAHRKLCPDLAAADIRRPREECVFSKGSRVTRFDYTIRNSGTAASGAFLARATVETQPGMGAVDEIETQRPVQLSSISVVTRPAGSCFDPDCTVTVEADAKQSIRECREDNNKATRTARAVQAGVAE